MCGPKAPQDNSHLVAETEARAAREAREAEAAREARQREEFESRLSGAYTSGLSSARNFFVDQGLDPEQYIGAITSAANIAKQMVPTLDGSPGTYFSSLGEQVFDRLQGAERSKALRSIDNFAGDGFASNRIRNDVDDPFLSSILQEEQDEASEYIRRLLDRGVITDTGFTAAERDLGKQRTIADTRLQDIGLSELERGRGLLRDIASTGRQRASNLTLGSNFDPFNFENQINEEQENFFAGLSDRLRANAPQDLFDTSSLLNIAGSSQGAGNTAFNPSIIAGLEDEEEEDEEDEVLEFEAF